MKKTLFQFSMMFALMVALHSVNAAAAKACAVSATTLDAPAAHRMDTLDARASAGANAEASEAKAEALEVNAGASEANAGALEARANVLQARAGSIDA